MKEGTEKKFFFAFFGADPPTQIELDRNEAKLFFAGGPDQNAAANFIREKYETLNKNPMKMVSNFLMKILIKNFRNEIFYGIFFSDLSAFHLRDRYESGAICLAYLSRHDKADLFERQRSELIEIFLGKFLRFYDLRF